ncbi:peptide ABC transporter substrate-binding protein [Candidatus Uhrbacteria bacterium]|jgi:peptide/nickel transport system substrate-binding protein|nr:peptide ABC transporter substrate-binding protein [Candidatus Uhrbacteria bacterium]
MAQVIGARETKKLPSKEQIKYLPLLLSKRERIIASVAIIIIIVASVFLVRHLINAQRVTIPAVGGEYTEGVVGSPQLINPLYTGISDVDADLARLVYSGLMTFDANEGLTTDLAESYEISEDGTQYTFTLRNDARWHDGQRVQADDIIFTISAMQNMDYRSPLEAHFQDVIVEQIDDRSVRFTIDEPFAPFISYLTVGILPSHIWQEIPAVNATLTELNTKPIGSGPYQFEKLVKDSKGSVISYSLTRHDGYHGESPYLETITFKFYPSNEAALDALRNHNIQGVGFVPAPLVDELQEDVNGTLVTPGMTQYTAAFFNLDEDILSDEDVREALVHATDTQTIIDEALFGYGAQINSFLVSGMLGEHPDLESVSYDVSAAQELLVSAGWTLPSEEAVEEVVEEAVEETADESSDEADILDSAETTDDISDEEVLAEDIVEEDVVVEEETPAEPVEVSTIREKNGTALSLELVTLNTPELVAVSELLKAQWLEIGVQVDVKTVDSSTLHSDILKNRSYDILLSGELYRIDPDLYAFWHSSQTSYPGLNLSGYENSSVDELILQARTSTDEVERADLYREIQENVLADTPAVFLYQPLYTYFVSDELQGVELSTVVSPSDRFSQVNEWYIKTRKVLRVNE